MTLDGADRTGAYPGSFNPPTTAHFAIAEAARDAFQLDRVDLIVSRVALAKEGVQRPRFSDRIAVLSAATAPTPWLNVVITDHKLIAEIAAGYDVAIIGADKWHQIQDPVWYGSAGERDRAMASLPPLAVLPREGFTSPHEHTLDLIGYQHVSSTRARQGELEMMVPAAASFATETGAWIDPDRYEEWLAENR